MLALDGSVDLHHRTVFTAHQQEKILSLSSVPCSITGVWPENGCDWRSCANESYRTEIVFDVQKKYYTVFTLFDMKSSIAINKQLWAAFR